jgi:Bacterial dnaA protein helix-turn-helix
MIPALPMPVTLIIRCVAAALDLSEKDIRRRSRDPKATEARHIAAYLSRELTDRSLPTIGRLFAGRDHSTIMHSIDVVRRRCDADAEFAAKVAAVREAIGIIGRSEFARLLDDPDAVAVAARVMNDPLREAPAVSTLEIAAMAARLLDLEEIAAGTFQLLAAFDELQCAGPARRGLIARMRALIETIASALAALGYAQEQEEEIETNGKDQDQGSQPARAAE